MGFLKRLMFGSVGEKLLDKIIENRNMASRIKALEERAAAYIKSGEIVYEKAYNDALKTISETENTISNHMKFRGEVALKLGEKVEQRLLKLEIKRSCVTVAEIKRKIKIIINENRHSVVRPFNTFDVFNILLSIQDYKHAEEQLDEAIKYYENMRMEAEKLNLFIDKLKAICKYLECEKKEIEILLKKIDNLFIEIEGTINKKTIRIFALKEKRTMKELKIIIRQIILIIKNNFIEENLDVNKKFVEQLELIKQINQNLPDAPVLRENGYSIKLINGKVH